MSRYWEVYNSWKADPEAFWANAAAAVHWAKLYDKVFDATAGHHGRWFPGALCNTAYNCLDRHVDAGRGAVNALIYDSPVTSTKRTLTYRELRDEVAAFAAVLAELGIEKGDRVVIYMPMVPEAVIAMLATARLGAIHSVVFGGFASNELAKRLDDAKPKVVVSSSCGVEPGRIVAYKPLLDRAIEIAVHKPESCVILQRPMAPAQLHAGRDHDWARLVAEAKSQGLSAECVAVGATDPLYILYTSGSTGTPKGVVRDNGGHMVALLWSMQNLYGVEPGEVFWAASDIGWVVGHSYIVYGPLLAGNTTVLYEGKPVGTPDARRVLARRKRAQSCCPLYSPDCATRDQEGGSARPQHPQLRPFEPAHAVPGRRARRSRYRALGRGAPEGARDRPLVADGDGLGHRRQSDRSRPASGQARLADPANARL